MFSMFSRFIIILAKRENASQVMYFYVFKILQYLGGSTLGYTTCHSSADSKAMVTTRFAQQRRDDARINSPATSVYKVLCINTNMYLLIIRQ